jgi:hypothetical protein
MMEWRPLFKKFIQETLSSACDRRYLEAAAFFEAFSNAFVIKPDDLASETRMGVGDKIAWVMFVLWRPISKLQSVGQLYRILEQALKRHGIVINPE